jgi:hypothetical protein
MVDFIARRHEKLPDPEPAGTTNSGPAGRSLSLHADQANHVVRLHARTPARARARTRCRQVGALIEADAQNGFGSESRR